MKRLAWSFDDLSDFKGSLLALLDSDHLGFIVDYLGVGGVFAGLPYAANLVAIPMLLDRRSDPITATITSLRQSPWRYSTLCSGAGLPQQGECGSASSTAVRNAT